MKCPVSLKTLISLMELKQQMYAVLLFMNCLASLQRFIPSPHAGGSQPHMIPSVGYLTTSSGFNRTYTHVPICT